MEEVWYYVLAIALGIIVVVIYLVLAGPSRIVTDLSNAFSGFTTSVTSAFGKVY
jgi:Flp pilus assembly pilin Flp